MSGLAHRVGETIIGESSSRRRLNFWRLQSFFPIYINGSRVLGVGIIELSNGTGTSTHFVWLWFSY